MPFTVERVPDQPIVTVHLTGKITIEELKEIFKQSVDLTPDVEEHIYRVTTVGEGANIGFGDVIATVRTSLAKMPGSSGDPRFNAVWVGKHHMAKLFADMLRSAPLVNVEMPFFNTQDEAMAYVQTRIEQQEEVAG